MNWNEKKIIQSFRGKLVCYEKTKQIIAQTVLKLPDTQIEYLTKHCWFLCSAPDSWAYAFNGNDVKDKHFIFLSDELLLTEPLEQVQYSIMHEIAHILLNHKNSIGIKQTKQEIASQEQEADSFTKKYLQS